MNKTIVLAAAFAVSAFTAPAMAQTAYTGGTASVSGLGAAADHPNSPFDQVTLSSLAGVYNGNGTYNLNGVTFTAGENSFIGDPTHFTGTISGLTGTFGEQTFDYSVDYVLDLGSTTDQIVLGGNTINVLGTSVFLNPLTLTSGGAPSLGILQARVGPAAEGAVPEPATWAMMLMGFGMVGAGLRYRRKQPARVAFA